MAFGVICMVASAVGIYGDASGDWGVMTGGEGRDIRMPMWMRFSMSIGVALLFAAGSVSYAILFVRGPETPPVVQKDQGGTEQPDLAEG